MRKRVISLAALMSTLAFGEYVTNKHLVTGDVLVEMNSGVLEIVHTNLKEVVVSYDDEYYTVSNNGGTFVVESHKSNNFNALNTQKVTINIPTNLAVTAKAKSGIIEAKHIQKLKGIEMESGVISGSGIIENNGTISNGSGVLNFVVENTDVVLNVEKTSGISNVMGKTSLKDEKITTTIGKGGRVANFKIGSGVLTVR